MKFFFSYIYFKIQTQNHDKILIHVCYYYLY